MEETLNGFVCTGDWSDVVEHGDRITTAFIETDIDTGEYASAFREWELWRPKPADTLSEEVKEKTADHASIADGDGEQRDISPEEDFKSAGNAAKTSLTDIEQNDTQHAITASRDSVAFTSRAVDSLLRRAIRAVEEFIYKNVMVLISPYYFDTPLVSGNIKSGRPQDAYGYRFEVNINDDAVQQRVADRLHQYEAHIDRWHTATQKDTATAEASKGLSAQTAANPDCDQNATNLPQVDGDEPE